MPNFSAPCLARLASCHKDLQTLFNEVIKTFNCSIIEGHRDQAAQDKAFADGKSKLKWPHGNHNSTPSNAVDVAFYPIDWTNIKLFYWFGGYVQGIAQMLWNEGKMTHKIRWGGAWSGIGKLNDAKMLNDFVHFEIVD